MKTGVMNDLDAIWEGLSMGRRETVRLALRLMGELGLAVWREVEERLMAEYEVGPGLARRCVYDLLQLGYIYRSTPKLYLNMRLSLIRLTELGLDAAEEVLGGPCEPGEWEMVVEGHRNGGEGHQLGMLALAWQARRRGYGVELNPGVIQCAAGDGWIEPDLRVIRAGGSKRDPLFVEYETKARGKMGKWRRYMGMKLLAVTGTAGGAKSLRNEMLEALPGAMLGKVDWYVTSLQELMQDKALEVRLLTHRV